MTFKELDIVTDLLLNPMPVGELIDHLWDRVEKADDKKEKDLYMELARNVSIDILAKGFIN